MFTLQENLHPGSNEVYLKMVMVVVVKRPKVVLGQKAYLTNSCYLPTCIEPSLIRKTIAESHFIMSITYAFRQVSMARNSSASS